MKKDENVPINTRLLIFYTTVDRNLKFIVPLYYCTTFHGYQWLWSMKMRLITQWLPVVMEYENEADYTMVTNGYGL